MPAIFSSFPILTNDLLEKACFKPGEYEFSYMNENSVNRLDLKSLDGKSNLFAMNDEDGSWRAGKNEIHLKRDFVLQNSMVLFGKDGIAARDAKLGVALMWTSQESKQRGIVEIGAFGRDEPNLEFHLDHTFEKSLLRGEVVFSTILYIKKEGNPLKTEKHLANREGCILGCADDAITIRLDGNGSEFPIYETNETGKPLWYVCCELDDPANDKFVDCFSINLNKSHPDFKYLEKGSDCRNRLIKEIVSNAMFVLISSLKSHNCWPDIIADTNLQPDSVAKAASYFLKNHGWDASSSETLSYTINEYFDKLEIRL